MTIIGIDPGSRFCGYGLIVLQGRKIVQAGCDVIKIDPKLTLSEKLVFLYDELKGIMEYYEPAIASVETIFYDKNIRSSFTLGHVRGVILFLIQNLGLELAEYSPREIKKSVVGNGNASKQQIHFMLKKSLKLKNITDNYDATDALAAAMCHYNKIRYEINV